MNQKPTVFLVGLLVCGMAEATPLGGCSSDMYLNQNACREEEESSTSLQRAEERESRQRDERRRWESVQVIEGNNVTTYYPSGDGQSYTGYSLRPR